MRHSDMLIKYFQILGVGTIVASCTALQNYHHEERRVCIFVIVLGSIAFFISFFGCCGALREHTCLMWTYASCLLASIIGNAVIIFKYLARIDGETKANHDINVAWTAQSNGKISMTNIQTSLKCCGINNSTDYINANLTIPNSCFVSGDYDKSTILFSGGCLKKLIAMYEAAEHWMTIFIWSSFSVEMVALISACVLAIRITNQQRRARY